MAEIVSASTGFVGSLTTIATCVGKVVGSLASFSYQLVTSVFKGITDCCKVLSALCTTLFGAFGEIFQYLADVFAECGKLSMPSFALEVNFFTWFIT